MRERPIPFSGPMVRAILDGTKTQTRRVAQPKRSIEPMTDECPYGSPGDRLWVKEAIRAWTYADDDECCVQYAADGHIHDDATWVWKRDTLPSMFMPRGLSRLTLTITDVRVERLKKISTADAWGEGIPGSPDVDPVHEYRELWDSLNAARGYGWDTNPWVWVVSFTRLDSLRNSP